jgi:CheY-like chemotaxis protein
MRTRTAHSAPAALAALQEAKDAGAPFSLVLIDACMPGMDGYALAKHLQQNPELAGAWIMMLASDHRPRDISRCHELSTAGHLIKPFKQTELLEVILSGLGLAAPLPSSAPDQPLRETRPLRILLAEDNEFNQLVTVQMLEKRGHTVTVAQDGREALVAYDRQEFDLVLMDVQMPEMDGLETTGRLRQKQKATGRYVPILALTAYAMQDDLRRCLEAGMDGHLAKPISAKELYQTIDDVVQLDSTLGPNERANSNTQAKQEAAESPQAAEAFDLDAALARVDGDAQFLRKLADMFLEKCPQTLAQIREAIARGNAAGVKPLAHNLKSAVGMFAAQAALDSAYKLETASAAGNQPDIEAAYDELEKAIGRLSPCLVALGADALVLQGSAHG